MPDDRPTYLTPARASLHLQVERGVKMSPKTLAKLRCIGGGPSFHKFGKSVFYLPAELDAWVDAKMSGPMPHTAAAKAGDRILASVREARAWARGEPVEGFHVHRPGSGAEGDDA